MSGLKRKLIENYVKTGQSSGFNTINTLIKMQEKSMMYKIKHYFPSDKSTKIIDLGCGYGSFLYFLRKNNYTNIAGVDSSLQQIELSKEINIDFILHADIIEYLKSTEETFDFIIMKDIMEHLSDDELDSLFTSLRERLNNQGKIYIHVPNSNGIYGMSVLYGDLTHIRAFNVKSIRQLLTLYNFKNIQVFEDSPVPVGIKGVLRNVLWHLMTLPYRILYFIETGNYKIHLSQNITILAEKND